MKLILGTAEWNPAGYNNDLSPSIREIGRILACAKEAGISIIDTAESYNCQDIIKKYAKGFCIYTKTRDWRINLDWGDNELRGILYHYQPNEGEIELPFIHRWVNLGVSIYSPNQIPDTKRILQIPFNIDNDIFQTCFNTHRTVFIRSVFDRGKLLKRFSIRECLNFVKSYRPDGIIIGVKIVRELEQILNVY